MSWQALKEFLKPTLGKILVFMMIACLFFITYSLLICISMYRFNYFVMTGMVLSTLGVLAESNALNISETSNLIGGYRKGFLPTILALSEIEITLEPIYSFLSLNLPTPTFPFLGYEDVYLSFFQIFLPLYWYILSCTIVWIPYQLKRIWELFKRCSGDT